ncbi:MAG: hypothetical protein JJE09_02440 [Bacteroidia bacterium]|nr:hypothetical protein [Bacteroidia bacterium]
MLGSNQQGLNTITAEEKLRQSGPNELEEAKKKSVAGTNLLILAIRMGLQTTRMISFHFNIYLLH